VRHRQHSSQGVNPEISRHFANQTSLNFVGEVSAEVVGIRSRNVMATVSAHGPSVWTGRALQAKNDDLEVMVLRRRVGRWNLTAGLS